jgi:hypothetical protein
MGDFNADESVPLLLEKDPPMYYDITNVTIPEQFTHIVYAFRVGDDYEQYFYRPGLLEAEGFAQTLVSGTPFTYDDIVIYDLAESNYYVVDGLEIQDAIYAATSGATVNVGPGEYDEQLVIPYKDITLEGAGDDTIIAPAPDSLDTTAPVPWAGGLKETTGIVTVVRSDVTVKDLAISGEYILAPTSPNGWLAGILYYESGGTIDGVTVSDLLVGSTTSVRGQGIVACAVDDPRSLEILNSHLSNYDKNGIVAIGSEMTVNIHDNGLVGRGPLDEGEEVQNGIVIIQDAVGEVDNNTISDHAYIPGTWGATGILFCNASGTARGNNSINNQMGIVTQILDGFGGIVQTVYFDENIVDASGLGVPVISGLNAATYVEGASLTVGMSHNNLLGGPGDGISIGDIEGNGPAGTVVATVLGNDIANWEIGLEVASEAEVTAHFNNILGNAMGISTSISQVNATNNWWGTTDGDAIADLTSGDVIYSPWTGASVGATTSEETVSGTDTVDATTTADTAVDKLGSGTPTVSVAKYDSNPGSGFSGSTGEYVDVHLDSTTGVDQITIKLYYTNAQIAGLDESTLRLLWWNGSAWAGCSEGGVNTTDVGIYSGYMWANIRADTTPSLSDLSGMPIGGHGNPPAQPPAAPPPVTVTATPPPETVTPPPVTETAPPVTVTPPPATVEVTTPPETVEVTSPAVTVTAPPVTVTATAPSKPAPTAPFDWRLVWIPIVAVVVCSLLIVLYFKLRRD